MTSYTALLSQYTDLSNNPNSANAARGTYLINYFQKQYVRKYFSDMKALFFSTQASVGTYKFPVDYKQFRECYIQVGAQKWTVSEIKTRRQFDDITFIQYTSDIPQYIYLDESAKQFDIFPIPASNGNQIYFNYKYRLLDLNIPDQVTGTATVVNGSATVNFSNPVITQAYQTCMFEIAIADGGDGQSYVINSIDSSTQITLFNTYGGPSGTYGYTIGQVPVMDSDFHDMLVYRALMVYYSSVQKDKEKFAQFKSMFEDAFVLLDEFAGNKSTGVDLSLDNPAFNPNNFLMY